MRKINSQVMRSFNLMQIVRTVQKHGPISRTALIGRVGLTAASVTNLTNELVNAGVLHQAGHENTAALGRKSAILEVNGSAFYVLGMEMNNCHIVVGLADFSSRMIDTQSIDFNAECEVDLTIQRIVEAIDQILERQHVTLDQVVGMGLALPGPLNSKTGVLLSPPNMPKWKNVPICAILEEKLQIPVCCDRETNAAALAESVYGTSASSETSFMLSLFTKGIGGSYVFNGGVVHGFRDGAGEIGHTTVVTGGKPCPCGNYGCLETVVSAQSMIERAQYLWRTGMYPQARQYGEPLTLDTVFALSDQGDPICRQVLEESANYLGIALRNVINILSPQVIILSGPLAFANAGFVEMIRQCVQRTAYPPHGKEIPIQPSAFGEMSFVKGGIMLALESFLERAILKRLDEYSGESQAKTGSSPL